MIYNLLEGACPATDSHPPHKGSEFVGWPLDSLLSD